MSPRLKKLLKVAVVAGVVGFVVLQVFPAKVIGIPTEDIGTNPPERYKIEAPPEVLTILEHACFDCHSNETKWPLYARIAPGSWLMARDVHKGRNHLNMSKWGEVDDDERQTDKENAWEQVEKGDMPPWFYIPMHPKAKLSDADKAVLKSWFMKDASGKDDAKKDDGAKKDGAKDEPAKEAPAPAKN